MIKKLSAVIALAVSFAACQSNATGTNSTTPDNKTTVNAANAPIMKFDATSHDFGKIKQGDSVSYQFKFTNAGQSPLIISDTYATCGCTKPTFDKTPIKPGDNGFINVTFNSAGKSGLQDKVITIVANTAPTVNYVHLTGEVNEK